jgi:hypothetical protein
VLVIDDVGLVPSKRPALRSLLDWARRTMKRSPALRVGVCTDLLGRCAMMGGDLSVQAARRNAPSAVARGFRVCVAPLTWLDQSSIS